MKSLSLLFLSYFLFITSSDHPNYKNPSEINVDAYDANFSLSRQKKDDKNATQNWKLGVALYTFHSFSFDRQLTLADSAGIKYVEGFSFANAGSVFKDSMIMQLSPAGIEKIKEQLNNKKIRMTSIYLTGGNNKAEWEKQFRLAKQLNVVYVTAEPTVKMWDIVDSLAGVYKMKVAIHNHWKGVSDYWSPDSVLAALKGHHNFGACPDLGHWPKSGINPVQGLKKLQGHIIGIHLKDIAAFNNPAIKDVPIGKGAIDFPGVFRELKRQNYKGYFMIERDAEEKPSNLSSVIYEIKYFNNQVKALK